MTISIWRYCHLILAVLTALFLFVASITGIVLAIEPLSHQSKGFAVRNLDEVSVSQILESLHNNYEEVLSIAVEPSGFVKASVFTDDFETLDIYIDPITSKNLGEVQPRPELFTFATNLHRSLFLKSTGRIFVGVISFLLFIITVTGLVLIMKRQGGITKLFSKVKKEYFEMRYHVIVSRWTFIPIIILSLTGVYLSAEKFELLPSTSVKLQGTESFSSAEYDAPWEIPLFKETSLSEVRKMDLPFSDDPEDLFHLELKDREIKVNQVTGEVVATAEYPFVQVASRLSFLLHTGEGSVLWSVVLLLASASLIFFMYSGFVMTIKRRKKAGATTEKITTASSEAEIVILIGSESGTSYDYGQRLLKALNKTGEKAFLTELNDYDKFPSAKHFVILTATYGDGEPPTNARLFEDLLQEVDQEQTILYSVVGFGSLEYAEYCAYAVEVDQWLREKEGFEEVLPLFKINDGSFTAFEKWSEKWSEKVHILIKLEKPKEKRKKQKQWDFNVVERTEMNADYTFLLRLRPKKKLKFASGDLLGIIPEGSENVRQYSIAKVEDDVLLSIKKHQFGKASNYLYSLTPGEHISAYLEPNSDFHFPKKSDSVVLIANGTGIAPFLGMVQENKKVPMNILWGNRTKASCHIYDTLLANNNCSFSAEERAKLGIYKCYSREEQEKRYVQDLVREQGDIIVKNFENNGSCMICGSLSMQNDVLEEIDKLLKEKSTTSLDIVIQKGQLKMDCY